MVRNIEELNHEIYVLTQQREAKLELIKKDASLLMQAYQPKAILKRTVNDIFGTQVKQSLMAAAIPVLLDLLFFKRASKIKRLLLNFMSSSFYNDIIKGEDSTLKKWAIQLKSWVINAAPDAPEQNNEELSRPELESQQKT